MIDHIVLLRPRAGIDAATVERLRLGLLALQSTIPGIEAITWGPNSSPEPLHRGYELGFVVRFVDAAARDAYLPHPDHVAVVPLVEAVAAEVLVFDLETGR